VIENARIKGVCPDRFEPVRQALQYNLDSGEDIGASVAVFIDGESVVDLWGGYFDERFERPWERDTIAITHSNTKTMTGMAALVLADSGDLDFDAPVAKYWPEFAQNGKSGVLVKHILSHTSGVTGWTEDVTWEDVFDHDKACDLLARQAPWWAPGTASAYHGICIGHLASGVIKRITGLTLGRYFAEHVATARRGLSHRHGAGTRPSHLAIGAGREALAAKRQSDCRARGPQPAVDARDVAHEGMAARGGRWRQRARQRAFGGDDPRRARLRRRQGRAPALGQGTLACA
jgi:hypothetical protein